MITYRSGPSQETSLGPHEEISPGHIRSIPRGTRAIQGVQGSWRPHAAAAERVPHSKDKTSGVFAPHTQRAPQRR